MFLYKNECYGSLPLLNLSYPIFGASSAMTKNNALKLEYRVKYVPAGSKYYELLQTRLI
jgi:hypothetical protein